MFGGNPALTAFERPQTWNDFTQTERKSLTMTLGGTITASAILLGITVATAFGAWGLLANNTGLLMPVWLGGMLLGLVLSFVIIFKPRTAPFVAPVYAACEGAFVGAISLVYASWASGEAAEPGGSAIVNSAGTGLIAQAALLTFGIFGAMLAVYATRLVKPTPKLLNGIMIATGGVFIFLMLSFLLSFIAPGMIAPIWSGPLGIGIAAVILVIATMNFIVDFAVIENGIQSNAPRYMEWYGAFGLLVTLVWVYISVLRLLSLLNRE